MIREEGGIAVEKQCQSSTIAGKQSPSFSGPESLEVGVRDGSKEEPCPAYHCIV